VEEEESEGLSWDEVEVGLLGGASFVFLSTGFASTDVMIRCDHAYQKLFPFIVACPCSLFSLPSSRIHDRHIVKLPTSGPLPWNVQYDTKLQPRPDLA
jgi:hypothetical protein